MSSPSSDPNSQSVKFPQIFDEALDRYLNDTNKDIKLDPLFTKLQDCKSSDNARHVLEEQALAFDEYLEGDWKVQLMGRLEPIVEILYKFSTKDKVKNVLVSVRLMRYNWFSRKFIVHLADVSTGERHNHWYWSPA
jgi:hypothetical protein